MTTARDEVLDRIRAALRGTSDPGPVARGYRQAGELAAGDVVARFVERIEDYRGTVVVADVAVEAIAGVIGDGAIGVPPDLPADLRPAGARLVEDVSLPIHELDALDGALTTCAAACADTGTIAIAGGPGEGRRALSLVPDLHVCVVRRDQIVETVPELFSRLEGAAREGRPIVLVSGPSATSDIELERVEGVHGPRRLVVVIVGADAAEVGARPA